MSWSTHLRKTVLTLSAVLLGTMPAAAATYWVSPTGVAGRSGADSLSNSTTLAWVNANARGGDIIRFKSGVYADPISPVQANISTSRLRFYGFPQDPTAVVVARIQFRSVCNGAGRYSTARWLTSASELSVENCYGEFPVQDSLVACVALAGGCRLSGQSCVADSLRLTGTVTDAGQTHFINIGGSRAAADATHPNGYWYGGATNNEFKHSTVNCTVNTTSGQGDVHVVYSATAAFNTISDNTINIVVQACHGYFFGLEQYYSYNLNVLRNTWNVSLNGAIAGSHGMWSQRDTSSYTRYVGNVVTITGNGSSKLSFMLTNPGSYSGTTGYSLYDHNVVRNDMPDPGAGVWYWYNGARSDTLQFNEIRTNASVPALAITGTQQNSGMVIRHNTFVSASPTVVDFNGATTSNSPRLTANIFYTSARAASGTEILRVSSGHDIDSAGVFFSPSGSVNNAIRYANVDGKPGSGSPYGNPNESVWGSPVFADSSYVNFNPALTSQTWAASPNFRDGYAGARPFAGAGADLTPPAVVTDLALFSTGGSSLRASWTAPGNDGSVGTASAYDLRWSTSPISALNFALANAVSPLPTPLPAGSSQSADLSGLPTGSVIYVALRTRDSANNWSGMSNVASLATQGDTVAPAVIVDLAVTP